MFLSFYHSIHSLIYSFIYLFIFACQLQYIVPISLVFVTCFRNSSEIGMACTPPPALEGGGLSCRGGSEIFILVVVGALYCWRGGNFHYVWGGHSLNPPPHIKGGQDLPKSEPLVGGGTKIFARKGDKPEKEGLMQKWGLPLF